ncbi:NAD(P)H-dependent oxidoreductase [Mycobacterium sp. NPDC003323]
MHSLVLFAHPQPESLTGTTARALAAALSTAEGDTVEVADLAAEGFDPRFTATDLAVMRGQQPVPADVRREQERVERADAMVLVYPVYWWGMPALLKGWIDRVISYGWAYGDDHVHADALSRLDIHLLALAGTDPGTYERHGYTESMRTGIEHGIFEYCGTTVASSHVIYNTEVGTPISLTDNITAVAADVTAAHEHRLCRTGASA